MAKAGFAGAFRTDGNGGELLRRKNNAQQGGYADEFDYTAENGGIGFDNAAPEAEDGYEDAAGQAVGQSGGVSEQDGNEDDTQQADRGGAARPPQVQRGDHRQVGEAQLHAGDREEGGDLRLEPA